MKTWMHRVLIVLGLFTAWSAVAEARSPNIIFIFADDWGYGDLSKHGSTFCQTPHLDRMAEEGIDFANFTVNASVCTPSRVAVMTGQFPSRQCVYQHFNGLKANRKRGMPDWMDAQGPSIAQMMQDAGYTTGHFGKWHIGAGNGVPIENEYGYDRFATFNGSKTIDIPKGDLSSVAHAEKFIREFHDEPFFVNLWLHEVHTPHIPQPRFMEKFAHLDEAKQVYASVIAEGDEGVGRIMALLKELKIDENTLVVFSTDNGPEISSGDKDHKGQGLGHFYSVGETGGLKGEKRSLFSGGIRVPFIVRWPGVTPAGLNDGTSVLTAVDLLPTFLAAANIPLPAGYQPDGENVLSAFKGEAFERSMPIFWEWRGGIKDDYTWPTLGVRDGQWKMVVNRELNKLELYDLEADWAEQKNLADEMPEVVQALNVKLDAWKATLPSEPLPRCCSPARSRK